MAQPQFVLVKDSEKGIGKNIELAEDGTFSKDTLKSAFPGARGLEYTHNGLPHVVSIENERFIAPRDGDGWLDKEFTIIRPDSGFGSRSTTPGINSSNQSEPSMQLVQPPPSAQFVSRWIFSTLGTEEHPKSAVLHIFDQFFVTFQHGTHHRYKVGNQITVRSEEIGKDSKRMVDLDGNRTFVLTVIAVRSELDLIVLTSDNDKKPTQKGPSLVPSFLSDPFILVGFGNQPRKISALYGSVHLKDETYVCNDQVRQGPFNLGTCRSAPGDSGAGMFSGDGLIGMHLGVYGYPVRNYYCTSNQIYKAISETEEYKRYAAKKVEVQQRDMAIAEPLLF